ncbi:hypothetical protein VTK73DRAFT_7905 [Phialemonium thermophilum]|uniref:tyrosinase n=1 Tax=Phialemonium thermophilum TaxID=223376 RepID=A0ABR3WC70_9PEZI
MSTTGCSSNSFENQHNEVHVAVGGLHPMGHFANLAYSGFDPVFMMHHAAIDRHVALWQAVHYNASMFTRPYATETGQFATAPGTNISADSPLKPFYRTSDGAFHTPNSARDVGAFGYTYPELVGDFASAEDRRRWVMAQVNRLYGGSSVPPRRRTLQGKHGGEQTASGSRTDYFAEIKVDKRMFSLPAVLQFWVGPAQAGRMVLPSVPQHGIMHGEVSLTNALVISGLRDFSSREVECYLGETLRWQVIQVSFFHNA